MPGVYRSTATVLVARPEMANPSTRAALTSELEARVKKTGRAWRVSGATSGSRRKASTPC